MVGNPNLYRTYKNSLVAVGSEWPKGEEIITHNRRIAEASDFILSLSELAASLGFDYFSYTIGPGGRCLGSASKREAPGTRMHSNYPSEWANRYDVGNYSTLDTVVHYAKRARRPFLWGLEEDIACLPRDARTIMNECAEFGIRSGLAIPAHGPGEEFTLFSMSTSGGRDKLIDLVRKSYNLLWLLSPMVQAIAMERLGFEQDSGDLVLTSHERDCLFWTSQGKTSWEIATIIGRSKATVEYHLQKAMRKLDATTKGQAAASAVRSGLI